LIKYKNNFAFLTFLKQTPSFIPFAHTLETISTVSDKENPARVQQLIEQAKSQSEEWEEYIWTLIEFSDDYTNNPDPMPLINESVGTSEKQREMLELTFHARIWRVIYSVSGTYWKAQPKLIDKETKTTLATIAKEIRSMEKTIIELKESARFADSHEGYDESLKNQLLDKFRIHLEKLKILQDEFLNKPTISAKDSQ
jgi:hypothetical protein